MTTHLKCDTNTRSSTPNAKEPSHQDIPDAALLNVQIHLDSGAIKKFLPDIHLVCEAIVESGHAIRLSFVESEDDGPHVDAAFETFNGCELWAQVQARLYGDARFGDTLKASSIAARTGTDGWDNYRLLSHFDSNMPLDCS